MTDDFDIDSFLSEDNAKPAAPVAGSAFDEGSTSMEWMDSSFGEEKPSLAKRWMKYHSFNLVQSAKQVKEVVDRALRVQRCSLDLESEGFDNRIDFDEEGRPSTVHKIVGYCIGIEGEGFYIPVRHTWNHRNIGKGPNVDSVEAAEREIARLCQAAQPILPEGCLDPLGAKESDFIEAPRVCIEFWHAKFDQEYLYPVTGIDIWHPASFEDGMFMAYVLNTDENHGLKENAKNLLPPLKDPETKEDLPYEMIDFKSLFHKSLRGNERKFQNLTPALKGEGWDSVLYGCSDAICTGLLCTHLRALIEKTEEESIVEFDDGRKIRAKRFWPMYRLEKQVAQAVRLIERTRVLIDKTEVQALLVEADKELAEYEEKIVQLAQTAGFLNFNPASSSQLAEFLFGEKGLNIKPKPEKTAEGQYKTDESTLEGYVEHMANPPEVLTWIIKHRQINKVRGTYIKNLAENTDAQNQIRLNFKQTGAATGRFTAPKGEADHGYAGVPIQGIPARDDPTKPRVAHSLRRVFVPRPGYIFVKADYASQELRIAANVSGEQKWIAEYEKESKTGEPADLHFLTAQAFYPGLTKDSPDYKLKRNAGKTANFALIYGGGVGAVQRATGCDKIEAGRMKEAFDASLPQFAQWVKHQHSLVKKLRGVRTAFGRFIAIPDAAITAEEVNASLVKRGKPPLPMAEAEQEAKRIRSACERKSTNFPIQGCLRSTALVQTRTGQHEIGSLLGSSFDVWIGEQWAPATAHDMGPCELAQVTLKDGTVIECDTRHKLMVITEEGMSWVEYEDLRPGMAIATSLCEPLEFEPLGDLSPIEQYFPQSVRVPVLPPSKQEDLWYWLGRYMGDGWLSTQGSVHFCFGGHEQNAIERCRVFFLELGLNPRVTWSSHTPHTKTSERCQVIVQNANFWAWLLKLGLKEGVTAHTKRFPDRIFKESLAHRRAFLKGVMDSDGHKPRLPLKVDGVWETNKKGNPYAVHLCQRPLLVDLKRLLRTVGVESTLRGPYRSGVDKAGSDTTSYRLDIQRRMYDQHVGQVDNPRLPKFKDMHAPQFLVDNFLSKGPFYREDFGGNESAYTLYLRFKAGGKASVYTLKHLCCLLGVELDFPIYAYKRLVSKEALGREENTYTLSVAHPLHRFESEGVITKNSGADILKISLVKLVREFLLRRWLKSYGGDDSVRLVMTVHDEVVFEIREDRVAEAVPILVKIMESPYKMVGWKVPLVVEPDLGTSWAAKISWADVVKGRVPRPPYLEGKVIEEDPHVFVLAEADGTKTPSKPPPASGSTPPTKAPDPKEPVATTPTAAPSIGVRSTPPPASSRSGYVSFRLKEQVISQATVVAVAEACLLSRVRALSAGLQHEMLPVQFTDGFGIVVYDARQKYFVHPEELHRALGYLSAGYEVLDD